MSKSYFKISITKDLYGVYTDPSTFCAKNDKNAIKRVTEDHQESKPRYALTELYLVENDDLSFIWSSQEGE